MSTPNYLVPGVSCRRAIRPPIRSQPTDPLALRVLKQVQTQPLTIAAMEPMGNYAYSIRFSDGHDTGIYSWSYLDWLGKNQESLWSEYLQRLDQAGASRDPTNPTSGTPLPPGEGQG